MSSCSLLFVLMPSPIFLTLLLILLLLSPCFVLCLRLVVSTLWVIFVFSRNTSLTFFPNAFSDAVLSVLHSCRQLILLSEFWKLVASQYLLSNIRYSNIIYFLIRIAVNMKTLFFSEILIQELKGLPWNLFENHIISQTL